MKAEGSPQGQRLTVVETTLRKAESFGAIENIPETMMAIVTLLTMSDLPLLLSLYCQLIDRPNNNSDKTCRHNFDELQHCLRIYYR